MSFAVAQPLFTHMVLAISRNLYKLQQYLLYYILERDYFTNLNTKFNLSVQFKSAQHMKDSAFLGTWLSFVSTKVQKVQKEKYKLKLVTL